MDPRLSSSRPVAQRSVMRRASDLALESAVFGGLLGCAVAAAVYDVGDWVGWW